MAELSCGSGGLSRIADRFPQSEATELEFSAKWGGEISKTSAGNGIYILALGDGKAMAFDYDPSEKRGAEKSGKAVGTVLNGADEIVKFLSSAVIQGDAPGFSIEGGGRTHRAVHFLHPTAEPLHVANSESGFVPSRSIPQHVGVSAAQISKSSSSEGVTRAASSAQQKMDSSAPSPVGDVHNPVKIGKSGKAGVRKKQVYHKRDQAI
jgi:hypothetical protein